MSTRVRPRPPYYTGWPQWRQACQAARRRPLPVTCPTCWGQGKLLEPGPLGLLPVICPECLNTR
jgi:hypothetical protein